MKEHNRYQRQMILKQIGREGQRLLDRSCVAVVGMGALGSVSANLLARAGVGHLRLVDRDFLELHNLQRQVLYEEKDVSEDIPKAIAARDRLRRVNSEILIEAEVADVSAETAAGLFQGVDLIVDGTDNFETRFLINDYALAHQVPWVYGGAIRTEGMSYVVLPDNPPCLRCLFGKIPCREEIQTCDQVGILAPVAHLIASFQATEAIKILAGKRRECDRRLWKVDIWDRHFKAFSVEQLKGELCSGCRQKRFPFLESRQLSRTTVLCGRNAVQIFQPRDGTIDFESAAEKISHLAEVRFNQYMLSIRDEAYELTVFPNGRVIVKGTEDVGRAKSLYARFVGC